MKSDVYNVVHIYIVQNKINMKFRKPNAFKVFAVLLLILVIVVVGSKVKSKNSQQEVVEQIGN